MATACTPNDFELTNFNSTGTGKFWNTFLCTTEQHDGLRHNRRCVRNGWGTSQDDHQQTCV